MNQVRIAILDDYQRVALTMTDWSALDAAVTSFPVHIKDPLELAQALQPFDVVVAMRERTAFTAELLRELPNLRHLVTTGPVNAAIDLAAATRHGVQVSGTDFMVSPTVELTWALVLSLVRQVPFEAENFRNGLWQTTIGESLEGRTLGVIGLGRIGSRVARVGQAFGMDTIGWSQNLTVEAAREVGVTAVDKAQLLSSADVVTVHLRLSERTQSLLGAAEFAAMKPSAYFVNTSRAAIVDEDALLDALESGRLAGAGVDVFMEEPLALDHRWRSTRGVVATPHLGYVTRQNYEAAFGQVVENIAAFLAGETIRALN